MIKTRNREQQLIMSISSYETLLGNFLTREDLSIGVRTHFCAQCYVVSIKRSKKNKYVLLSYNKLGSYCDRHRIFIEGQKERPDLFSLTFFFFWKDFFIS